MATPREMYDQVVGFFKGLGTVRKIVFVAIIAGALGALISLSFSETTDSYNVLYSALTQDDAAAIASRLKAQRIPYTLENGGAVILVPADKVLETRLQLAGEGLPRMNLPPSKNSDNSPQKEAGAADYVQRLNYQRALQEELARTIMQIPQLSYAQVHIAIPKESAFIENEKGPSASVIVKLRRREKLKSGQIKAIVNLVASAVAGLTPSNITVVDTEGHLLHRQEGDQESLLSATQLEYQRRVEEEYCKKVESMLEEVVGVDRAQAQVTAEIDFDRVDTTREDFDPEGQVVRSETLSESDAKRVEPATGPLSDGSNQRNNVTRNYEVSKVTRHVKAATGAIKRLSVAVMVDGNYEKKKGKDGSTLMQYMPRSQQEMANFTRVVKNAIGYNEDRGDQVEVVSVPFANSTITEPSQAFLEKWGSLIDKLAMPLMVLLIAIVALMLIVGPFFRMLAEKQRQREGAVGRTKAGRRVLQEEEEDLSLTPKKMTDKERLFKLAQSDPDRAADLVRRWLREEM